MKKLVPGKRRKLNITNKEMMTESLMPNMGLPLVIQPAPGMDLKLPALIGENREKLRARLHQYGGLLFRGFSMVDLVIFEETVRALSGDLLSYMEQSSPRHAIKGSVYTSTDYPPEEKIFLHNEQSYNMTWCGKISFFCNVEPDVRGQTPLADTRKILARLDSDIVDRFRKQGYRYMRNFGDGMGLTWQDVFQTENKSMVEAYCERNQIHFQWKSGNRLRTWQVRPVIRTHPETGEDVWFNHCAFFHVTTSPPRIRDMLLSEYAEEDLPNQTFYGDGQSIEPDTIAHIRKAYLAEEVMFNWRQGDVLILDNMLLSHGREPFSGAREILTAMSEPLTCPTTPD